MRELLDELEKRLVLLESRKSTPITEGRIAELLLTIVHIQGKVLDEIEKK
jgi:hypothetical protein